MKRPFVWFAWSFGACLFALSLWLEEPPAAGVAVLCALTVCFVLAVRKSGEPIKAVFVLLLAAALALFLRWGFDRLVYEPVAVLDGKTRHFTLTATEDAEGKGTYGVVSAAVDRIDGAPVRGRVLATLYLTDASPEIRAGDRIEGELLAGISENGLDFDSFTYYKAKGVYLTLSQLGGLEVSRPEQLSWQVRAARMRSEVVQALSACLPAEEAGLAAALITGDRSGLTASLRDALAATGLSHIAAVSGLHVSMLMGFVWLLLGKRAGSAAALPVLLFFVAITGFSPSAVRAAMMHLVACGAFFLRREQDPLSALALALTLILLKNPYTVRDISFLLSFLATIGILLFSERIKTLISAPADRLSAGSAKRLVKWISASAATTVGALIFTLPVGAVIFLRVSLITPVSNLLVLPLIGPAFLLSGLTGVAGLWSGTAAGVLAVVARPALAFPIALIRAFEKIPFSSVPLENMYFIGFLAAVYGTCICWRKTGEESWARPAGLCLLLLMLTLIFTGVSAGSAASITAIRAEGPAVVLRQGTTALLVDCGSGRNGAAARRIGSYLTQNRLLAEMLILTCVDDAHAGAAPELIAEGRVRRVMLSAETAKNKALLGEIVAAAIGADVELMPLADRVETGSLSAALIPLPDGECIAEVYAGNASALCAHVDNLYAVCKAVAPTNREYDLLMVDGGHIVSPQALIRLYKTVRPEILLVPDRLHGEPLFLPMAVTYGDLAGEVRLQGWEEKNGEKTR